MVKMSANYITGVQENEVDNLLELLRDSGFTPKLYAKRTHGITFYRIKY